MLYVASSTSVVLHFFMARLRAAQERGFEVTVACPDDGGVERLLAAGFKHLRIPTGRTASPVTAAVTWLLLTTWCIERKPVLVHSHTTTVHLPSALAARASEVPICVATIHGHYHTGLEQLMAPWMGALVKPLSEAYYRVIAQLVDAYLVINESEAEVVSDFVEADKLHLIRGGVGVDTGQFHGQSARREAQRRLRLDSSKRWVGFVGRLLDHKARDLLAALDDLQRQEPGVGVLIVALGEGDPEIEVALAARVAQGRAVVLIRDRHPVEMPLIYQALDVLWLPSRREGASTVLMEAAAMRVPVVAYDIAGTRDIVSDKVTGRLCPVGRVEAFVAATRELLRSAQRRRELGSAARAQAEGRFDRQAVQDQVFTLYDALVDKCLGPQDPS